MSDRFNAACLCGGIQLTHTGKLGPANYCHCEDCRKANGSAFNVGVRVERKNLEICAVSEIRSYRFRSSSGREIERCFCGTCGSPLFTLHPDKPEYAWVKAGIINEADIIKPVYEIWVRDKVKWATIDVADSYESSRPSKKATN